MAAVCCVCPADALILSASDRQHAGREGLTGRVGPTDHSASHRGSTFKAVLNEKDAPAGDLVVTAPSYRAKIVSDRVFEIRSHTDFRIARRALIISRLAQMISERKCRAACHASC